MVESQIKIETGEGAMGSFIVHRPAYAADADARHWRALLDLFARNPQPSMTTLGFLKERP